MRIGWDPKPALQWLDRPVDPRPLALYRIIFGAFMVYEMLDYFMIGLIRNMYVLPAVNFSYDLLEWMRPLPENVMLAILAILLACAVCILIGLWLRLAALVFAAGYAYIFLLDKSIYNNHIYLFILIALLLSMTRADNCLSVRNPKGPGKAIPFWQIGIFQFQIVIVYFYGGIAKMTYDWLVRAQPVTQLIGNMPASSWLAKIFQYPVGILTMNYGGFLIDIGAPLFLWVRRVRRFGIYPFIAFHLLNSQIFQDIGIFPFVMLGSLLLFYLPEDLPWLYKHLPGRPGEDALAAAEVPADRPEPALRLVHIILAGYFSFQLLMPFRGLLLPNDLDWTTIGNRFSWRMKVDTRQVQEMNFFIVEEDTRTATPVNIRKHLNDMQLFHLSKDPRSIVQYARFLADEARRQGLRDPHVVARILVSYNARQVQYFIKPDVDLSREMVNVFKRIDWLYPVTGLDL